VRRQPKSSVPLLLFFLLISAFFIIALILMVELKLRPIVETYAESRARLIATRSVNEAIEAEMESRGDVYGDIIRFEHNINGDIIALKADSIKMNRMKSSIIERISQNLADNRSVRVEIPLGNLINGELFSGRGPKIEVLLQMTFSVNAGFVSCFEEAGINQTLHRILVDTKIGASVLMPGGKAYFETDNQMNLAETIIVGDVPQTYTDIQDSRESAIEKYSEYTD